MRRGLFLKELCVFVSLVNLLPFKSRKSKFFAVSHFAKVGVTFFPNGTYPILEQTSLHGVTLSAASNWCSSSVKYLLSSCVCRPICLHSGFKQPLPQTHVYVAWNRATEGIAFAQNVFMMLGCGSDSFVYISLLLLCGWGRYRRDQGCQSVCQPCIRITRSTPSYLPDTPGEQDTHPFRFFPTFIYFFLTRTVMNLRTFSSGVSQRGFIQHSSLER